jgi:hypothetical protein
MLDSHALLLGVPINRADKNIRLFCEEHYKLFRVFFMEFLITAWKRVTVNNCVCILWSILFSAYAKSLLLLDLVLDALDVEVKSIRRLSLPKLEPTPQTILAEGDSMHRKVEVNVQFFLLLHFPTNQINAVFLPRTKVS